MTGPDSRVFTFHEGEIPYLSADLLDRTGLVRTAVSLRRDRNGEPVTLYWREGDDLAAVERGTRRFLAQMDTDPEHLVMPHQEHTNTVRRVGAEDLGACLDRSAIPATDGLITNARGAVLAVYTADCLPLFFLDPVNRAAGLAHSGRRGTMSGIGPVTAAAMKREFGTEAGDLLCCIGPCICGSCYEVGDEILQQAIDAWGAERADRVMARRGGRWHLDLRQAALLTLLDAGLKRQNIAVTDLCTKCRRDILYSLRGDGRIENQIASVLRLL